MRNATQRDAKQLNETRRNTTQHNTTQCNIMQYKAKWILNSTDFDLSSFSVSCSE